MEWNDGSILFQSKSCYYQFFCRSSWEGHATFVRGVGTAVAAQHVAAAPKALVVQRQDSNRSLLQQCVDLGLAAMSPAQALSVTFIGESGVDAGGLTKELCSALCDEALRTGLFVAAECRQRGCHNHRVAAVMVAKACYYQLQDDISISFRIPIVFCCSAISWRRSAKN